MSEENGENTVKGFIANYDLIQEDCRVEDLLDFSEATKAFTNRLYSIDRSATIGLVGKFGCGKSTMLFQIQEAKKDQVLWINFDAWKYPDRKDLWEGFVLDFADQIGKRKKVLKDVEGKSTKSDALGILVSIGASFVNQIPGLGTLMEKFVNVFSDSPASRVFEIQYILSEMINNQTKDIYIVVEDIDRSGDAGIFFLETLKQFIRGSKLDKRVIVIAPIGADNYHQHIDSYLKCIDYIEFFKPKNVGLTRFVESIFITEQFEVPEVSKTTIPIPYYANRKGQVVTFLEELLKQPEMTIRLIKLILRKADMVYMAQCRDKHEPDWRVTICFEASKYVKPNPKLKETFFENFQKNKVIASNTIFASFLFAMLRNLEHIYNTNRVGDVQELWQPNFDFDCITRNRSGGNSMLPSEPFHLDPMRNDKEQFGVCDFYLEYE